MDIEEISKLLATGYTETAYKLLPEIITDVSLFDGLVDLALGNDKQLARNAAYLVYLISEEQPDLLRDYSSKIEQHLPELSNNSQVGLLFKTLENISVDLDNSGSAIDFAFHILSWSNQYSYAKLAAIKYLDGFCEKEPDLGNELMLQLEKYIPFFEKRYLIDYSNEVLEKWRKRLA